MAERVGVVVCAGVCWGVLGCAGVVCWGGVLGWCAGLVCWGLVCWGLVCWGGVLGASVLGDCRELWKRGLEARLIIFVF